MLIGRRVSDGQRAVRCARRGEVKVVGHVAAAGKCAITGRDDGVVGVGDQIVPGARFEERADIGHLPRAGSVEETLPAGRERPGVMIAVELAGCAAEIRPVFLLAQDGRGGDRPLQALKLVVGLDEKYGLEVGAGVVFEDLDVGRIVGVRGVQADDRRPPRVIQRPAGHVVQLDGVNVVGVGILDAERNGRDDRVHARVAPVLEIIATHPDEVGEILVAVAEVLSESAATVCAVVEHGRRPPAGFNRIQKHHQAVLGRQGKHLVAAGEIGFVRFGQIVMRQIGAAGNVAGEGSDAVVGGPGGVACGIGRANQIDPEAVKGPELPVGEVKVCVVG